MSFTFRETQIVKGMLLRGDKQHDIASYFGVNGGRVADVSTGKCAHPNAPTFPEEKLPPPGPYVGAKTVFEIVEHLREAKNLIISAGDISGESKIAIEALDSAILGIQ